MFRGPPRVVVPRSCSGFQSLLFTLLRLSFLLIFSGAELPKLRGGRLLPSLSDGCREISGRNTFTLLFNYTVNQMHAYLITFVGVLLFLKKTA